MSLVQFKQQHNCQGRNVHHLPSASMQPPPPFPRGKTGSEISCFWQLLPESLCLCSLLATHGVQVLSPFQAAKMFCAAVPYSLDIGDVMGHIDESHAGPLA